MSNIIEFDYHLTRKEKAILLGTKGAVFWLTGLSGAGKSTLANEIQKELFKKNKFMILLDGDTIRKGLCKDLSFSNEDRLENLRRVAEVSKLLAGEGLFVVCSFITPLEKHRQMIAEVLGDDYYEIYIEASFEICKKRDPKGLYQKAEVGEIKNFTGIDSIYERPIRPALILNTEKNDIETLVQDFLVFIIKKGLMTSKECSNENAYKQ